MAKIKSCDWKSSITFELNLHKGKGFIYDKSQADYLNWIPYEFLLKVEKDNYIVTGMAFSLEGIKIFLSRLRSVIDERNITQEYKEHSYCGAEAEFTICLKNTDDFYEDVIVLVKLWINAACLENAGSGYSIGFDFIIKYEDLKRFTEELMNELTEILKI